MSRMIPEDKLSEKWPWQGEFLRLLFIIPTALGIIGTIAFYPIAGSMAFWYLTCVLAGAVFYFMYRVVGRRVNALKDQINDTDDWAEGLLVIDKMQCPGLVVRRESEFELFPIVGKGCVLPFEEIHICKEGR